MWTLWTFLLLFSPENNNNPKPLEKIGKVYKDQNRISVLLNSLVAPIIHFSKLIPIIKPGFCIFPLSYHLLLDCLPHVANFENVALRSGPRYHLLWSNQASCSNFLSINTSRIYWHRPLLFHWTIHEILEFTNTLIPRTGTAQVWTKGKGQRAVFFRPISFFFPLSRQEPWKHYSVCPQPKFLAYL